MKIKYLLMFITSLITFTAYAYPSANDFLLGKNSSIETWVSAGYDESYSITVGESYAGTYVYGNTLVVYADRKGSATPATWVESGLTALNIPWTESYATTANVAGVSHDIPSTLNFAIVGTLTFTYSLSFNSKAYYTCKNVYIAQGHSGSRNNWWIFNNNPVHYHSLFCENDADGTEAYFSIGSVSGIDVNALSLTLISEN